jgi:3-hydroxyisobutyrate dehydrogenase-like beta-hydroxyacid dehydrogenase
VTLKTGILHPGEMGSYIASTARATLGTVYWCSQERSPATRQRAGQHGLDEITRLQDFCDTCDLIISVCPPHAAVSQAEAIVGCGFKGIYVDANAISPESVITIGTRLQSAGIAFVDGGIIGLPTGKRGDATLYLSGAQAAAVAACFTAGPLEARVLGPDIGQASALKMCYAAWNKGKTALLTAVLATAEHMHIREALEQQWNLDEPGFAEQSTKRLRGVARKAWRFGAEMDEIAATLRACGVPAEFFDAAAELYRRESSFKDTTEAPPLADILAAVTRLPPADK